MLHHTISHHTKLYRSLYCIHARTLSPTQGSMRGREGRTAFLSELKLHGVEESFLISDRDDVCVSLTEIGWKSKYVEVLEINRPHEAV